MSEFRRIKLAGPSSVTYTAYSPAAPDSESKSLGVIRRGARRVGKTIKQKGEQLLNKSGQPVAKPRPGPPRSEGSYLIPQHHAELRHGTQDDLLDRIFNKTELTIDSHSRPLNTHPPRRDSIYPLQTRMLPYSKPSDTASPHPENPADITQEPQSPQGTYEAPVELPSEPATEYAAEFADAEGRYRTLLTPPLSPPHPKTREDPLSAAKRRSRRSSRMVPAVADGRPPYPVTPPAFSPKSTNASSPPRIPKILAPSDGKLQHPPKRAITMDDSLPTKRRRMSKLPVSGTTQVSHELHFEDNEPFCKGSVPSKAVIAELEGNACSEEKKALKRSSHSMPDLHFDFGFPANAIKVGFTRTGSPVGLKAGPSETGKSLFVATSDHKALNMTIPAPWKIYAPEVTRRSLYKAYIKAGLPGDLSHEVSVSVQASKSQKLRNRNYTAYIQKAEELHELEEEASLSEEALKAQKLKNRISSGFMPDQTPLTDVIRAATEANLISTDFTNTMQDVDSPISPLEPSATAWAGKMVITPAVHVSETLDEAKIPPTTFDAILGTPANKVDALHLGSSEAESAPDREPALAVTIVDSEPVSYQTLRRVRAAKVEMRTLARPLPLGESANCGSLLDAPVSSTLTSSRSSRLLTPTMQKHDDDDPSWNWGRFVDKDYEDPAAEVSRRFRQRRVWAKNNTGPLVAFEGRGYGTNLEPQGDATDKENSLKRWSWRQMAKGKSVVELLDLFEGR